MSARTCSGATSPLTNLDVSGAGISRFLVGGPGWSGAGPAAVGTGVLPLSVDDPGARVTCGSRALVTADKGNDPSSVRSNAGVGAGTGLSTGWPRTHAARDGTKMNIEDIKVLRRHRASARSEHWATALSQEGRKILERAPAQRRGAPARCLQEAGRSRKPAGGGRPACHHRGPGRGGGSGHGHHRGLPARTVDATHRRPDTGQRQDRRQGRGRHRRRGQEHAPHPESHQRLGRGRGRLVDAHGIRPGPGPPGQPDQGPDPGPVAQPRPHPTFKGRGGTLAGRTTPPLEARHRLAHPSRPETRGQDKDRRQAQEARVQATRHLGSPDRLGPGAPDRCGRRHQRSHNGAAPPGQAVLTLAHRRILTLHAMIRNNTLYNPQPSTQLPAAA